MKTLKTLSTIMALAAGQMMTSCLGSGDENAYTVTSNYTNLFNAVVSNDGEVTLYPKQSVKVDWGYGDPATANIQILGLQLPNMGEFPTLQFSNIPWTYNAKGWMDISMVNAKPGASAGYMADITFNRFNLQTVNRLWQGKQFPPCINISYTIEDKYRVYSLPVEIIEVGNTTVRNAAAGTTFTPSENDQPVYYIELDPSSKKALVAIQGAKFAEKMPAMNLRFPSIPFDVNQAGNINLYAAEFVPEKMTTNDITKPGDPYPGFPITNFRANYIADYGVTISFTCTIEQMGGAFDVSFTSLFPTSASSNN